MTVTDRQTTSPKLKGNCTLSSQHIHLTSYSSMLKRRHDSLSICTSPEIQDGNSLLIRSDDSINQATIQVSSDLDNPPLSLDLSPATTPRIRLIVRVTTFGLSLVRELYNTPFVVVAAADDVDDALPHGRRRIHDGRQPLPRLGTKLIPRAVCPAQRRLRLYGPFWEWLGQRGCLDLLRRRESMLQCEERVCEFLCCNSGYVPTFGSTCPKKPSGSPRLRCEKTEAM